MNVAPERLLRVLSHGPTAVKYYRQTTVNLNKQYRFAVGSHDELSSCPWIVFIIHCTHRNNVSSYDLIRINRRWIWSRDPRTRPADVGCTTKFATSWRCHHHAMNNVITLAVMYRSYFGGFDYRAGAQTVLRCFTKHKHIFLPSTNMHRFVRLDATV